MVNHEQHDGCSINARITRNMARLSVKPGSKPAWRAASSRISRMANDTPERKALPREAGGSCCSDRRNHALAACAPYIAQSENKSPTRQSSTITKPASTSILRYCVFPSIIRPSCGTEISTPISLRSLERAVIDLTPRSAMTTRMRVSSDGGLGFLRVMAGILAGVVWTQHVFIG